ncbi:chaplin [Streptomyces sp. NPDC057838]|uniref:chaplin n=1 Tax=unclassified Streptomyces TaxID=2593676 RepID=UPI0036CB655E
MRQTLSRGMVAAAAATGILSLCGGAALADSTAEGAAKGSPGAASGNDVQVPVDVPVNACGNTVDVVAALNPAFGNSCANGQDGHGHGDREEHRQDSSGASSYDDGDDLPGDDGEDWPGDEDDWLPGDGEDRSHAGGEPSRGDHGYGRDDGGYGRDDDGGYGYGDTPPTEPPHTPPATPPHHPPATPPPGGHQSTPPHTPPEGHHTPPGGQEQPPSLPETGAQDLFGSAAASAALITGGIVLYRRGRAASHR